MTRLIGLSSLDTRRPLGDGMAATVEMLPIDKKKLLVMFTKLLSECEWMDVAVAWARENEFLSKTLKASGRLRYVVIGTHMYHTSPQVLRNFMLAKACQFPVRYMPPDKDMFHPKVYVFGRANGDVSIAIGSHNWTDAAIGGKNVEAGVLIRGAKADPAISRLISFVTTQHKKALDLDADFIARYGVQYTLNRKRRATLLKKVPAAQLVISSTSAGSKPAQGIPLGLDWNEYVKLIKSEPNGRLTTRLNILFTAQSLFGSKQFNVMSPDERRCLAGTVGKNQNHVNGCSWGWFGTVTSGGFKSVVLNHPDRLSAALAKIPSTGPVSRNDYDAFVTLFDRAFHDQDRGGRVPTASRLLAMYRPDVFVCVNGANKSRLCSDLGIPASSLVEFDPYWSELLAPIHRSAWWNAKRPVGGIELGIWNGRMALLDGIYYEPH